MLTPAQTAAVCVLPIEQRDDHIEEALWAITDPDAIRNIENARAHLAAFNAWPVEGENQGAAWAAERGVG